MLAGCTNTPPPPLVSAPPSTTQAGPPNTREIVVGVDDIAGGYNPHTLADQSTMTTALSSLLLPSVFRPAPDGSPMLDRTLMVSAEVTKTQPYTVTYRLRGDASWSDGAPIAAEDFVYLWKQIRDQPGTVDSAGYRLISDITLADGGKVVEVTFSKPYPGWRSLFSSLLPAHVLKDAPGGWESALDENFPSTAGPFSIKTLDNDRGEIVLERNERYWDQPALLDRLVLRRADQSGLVDALRSGYDQVAITRTDAVGVNRLRALGDSVAVHTVPRPTVVSLVLRPVGEDLSERNVRAALAAMLDRGTLIDTATERGPESQFRADGLVLAPSQLGYKPTLPQDAPSARPDPALAQRLLTEAGYQQNAGVWMRDGRPLSILIAAPAGREPYEAIAEQARRQLTAAGVSARVVTPEADQLFTQLPAPTVGQDSAPSHDGGANIVVAPSPVGANPTNVLASNFGCPPETVDGQPEASGNVTGFCDTVLQQTIDAALTGSLTLEEALADVEPELWRQAVSIPLYQTADTLVVRQEVTGVEVGSPLTGPFGSAAIWRRGEK